MRRVRMRQDNPDAGIALVVAVALVGLVTTLMLVMVTYALRETSSTGFDRQRSAAVAAAEGQLDATFAKMQLSSRGSLACGKLDAVPSRQSVNDTMSVVTTVTYYDAAGAVVPCSQKGSVTLVKAKVSSVATSEPLAGKPAASRMFESMVNLRPVYSQASDKAMFGDAGVTHGGSATVTGNGGKPNANTYSNGPVRAWDSCTQHGNLQSQEPILVKGSCTVHGDVHSNKGIIMEGSVTVHGKVLAHAGNISMGGTAVIGEARASGNIDWLEPNGCSTAPCVKYTDVAPVARTEFPVINFDRAAWEAAGYLVVDGLNDCTPGVGGLNEPAHWVQDNINRVGRAKTVFVTTCQLNFPSSVAPALTLSNDMAIFADRGFTFGNSDVFSATAAKPPFLLHLIQPYSATARPCTAGLTDGITFGNSNVIGGVDNGQGVNAFIYSACNVELGDSNTFSGQIYSGGVINIRGSLTLHYQTVPVAGVVAAESTVSALVSYKLDVIYKREVR